MSSLGLYFIQGARLGIEKQAPRRLDESGDSHELFGAIDLQWQKGSVRLELKGYSRPKPNGWGARLLEWIRADLEQLADNRNRHGAECS